MTILQKLLDALLQEGNRMLHERETRCRLVACFISKESKVLICSAV